VKQPALTREQRKAFRRRRYQRHYRRCEPLDHERPWVKYSRRAVPSTRIEPNNAGSVHWLRMVFDPIYRAAKRAQQQLGG
jgi:hypothetical protein